MQRIITCLFFGLLVVSSIAQDDVEVEKVDVKPLTDSDFETTVHQNDLVLVEFYAPWCGHCKRFASEYNRIDQNLQARRSPVKVFNAKSEDTPNALAKYQVGGYPTILLFVHGHPIPYSGTRSESAILEWLETVSKISARQIDSAEELNLLRESQDVVTVFWGDDSEEEYKVFDAVAKRFEGLPFVYTSEKFIKRKIGASDEVKITLLRKWEPEVIHYNEQSFDSQGIANWISYSNKPEVTIYNQQVFERVFQSTPPAMFLLLINDEKGQQAVEVFKQTAKTLFKDIQMIIGYAEEPATVPLLDFSGLQRDEVPAVCIFEPVPGNYPLKYKMDGPVTEENIIKFHDEYVNKAGKTYQKSLPIPETNDEPVKIVVGDTFDNIVLDSTKDVLIEFFSPGCNRCNEFAPVYEEVAQKVAKVKNLVIAKIDGIHNDIEAFPVGNFPTIMFFPAKSKDKPVEYDGEKSVDELVSWLKSNAKWAKWPKVEIEL